MTDETLKRLRELSPPDCGDNSCAFALKKGGMRTNGGCRCLEYLDSGPRMYFKGAATALPELLDEVDRLEARVKELSNPATWRATINRLESAELEALAELDERIAENAALRERVEKLEKAGKQLRAAMIRPIADDVLIEKFKAAEEKWAAALDRAGEP